MDPADFLRPRLRTRTVPTAVGDVTVRGLSRPEAIEVSDLKGHLTDQERLTLLYGLVDPALSEEDVAAYYATADVDEVQAIVAAVQDLSLTSKGSAKSGVPGLREEPGP